MELRRLHAWWRLWLGRELALTLPGPPGPSGGPSRATAGDRGEACYIDDLGLSFTEREFETPNGTRAALVIAPTAHVRVGLDRLARLRDEAGQPPTLAPIDRGVLEEARRRAARVQITVFRGRNDDDTGSWDFADELNVLQATEMAYLMLRSQMLVYRGLVKAGLCLHLHVEWTTLAVDVYRQAIRRRIGELNPGPGLVRKASTDPIDLADLWILKNLTFFFSIKFENLITTILPDKLSMLERRMARVRDMVLALPDEAFGEAPAQ